MANPGTEQARNGSSLQRLKERRDEMTSSEEQRRLKETYCFVEAIRSQIRTQDAIRALVHHMLHARDAA